jgi:hypothetical protein
MRINTVSNVINFSTLLSRYATFRFWHFPRARNAPGAWMTNYFGKPTKTRRELPKPKGERAQVSKLTQFRAVRMPVLHLV